MATSGSTNYTQNRNEAILDALSLIGCNSIGKEPSADDLSVCNRFLNKMIKAWQAKGLHLWTKEEGILFLDPYVGQYDLGLATTKFAIRDSVVTTYLTTSITANSNVITVKSSEGMIVGSPIGVLKNDGYLFWTTIDTINSSTSITLVDNVPVAVGSTNYVYSYSEQAGKPMRILDARTLSGIDLEAEGTSLVSTPLTIIPYSSYWNVGITSATSTLPNQGTYVPKDVNGRFYIWPQPLRADKRIQITYERMMDDMDTARDDFDLPSEWLEPITFQLAIRVAPIFGKEAKAAAIAPMAQQMLENLLDWDTEITNITFQPYYNGDDDGSFGDSGARGWGR